MRHRHDAGAWAEQPPVVVEIDGAIKSETDQPDTRTGLLRDALPRNQVRVVFERGRQDLVTWLQVGSAPGDRHQIQGLSRVADEDDLLGAIGADEAADAFACRLVRVGGFDAQGVHAAVHVGVGGGVEVDQRVDHLARLLGGGRVVEVDQPPAVDLALKDREVGADTLDVERS